MIYVYINNKMSDLYVIIKNLIYERGYTEFAKEYEKVMEYMRAEARCILGIVLEEKKEDKKEDNTDEKKVIVNEIIQSKQVNMVTEITQDKNMVSETTKEIQIEQVGELKDQKRTQRQKERYRREWNVRNGVNDSEVLTVSNVTKWLKEGRSYAWIASEKVGCKQEEVSRFAKLHKLV